MPDAVVAAVAAGLAVLAWRAEPGARLRRSRLDGTTSAGGGHAGRPRMLWSAAAAGSALVLTLGLGWWGLVLAAAIVVASYLVLGRLATGTATRRRHALLVELPQACDLLAVCLESGLPLRNASAVVAQAIGGPLGAVLAELDARVRLGTDEARAWQELGRAEPALAALGTEVGRAADSGTALSRRLRSLGADARRDAASEVEVRARRVGVRSVLPLMLCFLPAFLLLGVVPVIGGVARHLFP